MKPPLSGGGFFGVTIIKGINMELDFQFFFNAIAGILTFVAGWVFKVVYESIK